jgi:hypothetical protein
MALTTVAAALEIVGKVSKALDSLRERAKTSKDASLKEGIYKLWDDFLDLKAIISRLTDENTELKQKIAQSAERPPKPEIRQVGETNYYFVGELGPYCQKCFDTKEKLVILSPVLKFTGGPGRKCEVCTTVYFEQHKPRPRIQIKNNWV